MNITLKQMSATPEAPLSVNAGVKTILLAVQNEEALDRTLETALALARACGAHLSCLHVTPIEAYIAFDSFGGVFVMNDVFKAIEEDEKSLRAKIDAKMANEDVSWDFTQTTGTVPNQIISRGSLADLIVVGRLPKRSEFQRSSMPLLGDLLHRSRTPLFVASDGGEVSDLTGSALIAWNGSIEAANAVRSAVGLLKLASDVRILRVDEQLDEAFPSTFPLQYLSRHGIHAELIVETAPPDNPDADFTRTCMMSHAERAKAAYIVMGGYSHSRISEYVFGGLTRSMLAGCAVPLFITR